MILRNVARKPVTRTETYLKYGFVTTEHQYYYCPRCGNALNAGPQYQPRYCPECGQKVTFEGVKWKADVTLEYVRPEEGRSKYAPIKN